MLRQILLLLYEAAGVSTDGLQRGDALSLRFLVLLLEVSGDADGFRKDFSEAVLLHGQVVFGLRELVGE